MFTAIPQSLQNYWYVYELILVAVIIVSLTLLRLLKKRSNYKEGQIALKRCLKHLRKSLKGKTVSVVRLHYAENLLGVSIASFTQYADQNDLYELREKIAVLQASDEQLSVLSKNPRQEMEPIRELIKNLERVF